MYYSIQLVSVLFIGMLHCPYSNLKFYTCYNYAVRTVIMQYCIVVYRITASLAMLAVMCICEWVESLTYNSCALCVPESASV